MGILTLSSVFFLVALLQGECDATRTVFCQPGSTVGSVSPCALTCGNVDNPPVGDCPEEMMLGCVCDKGLYAQTGTSGFTSQCVKPGDCDATCGPNKTYQPNALRCTPTCQEPTRYEYCRPPQIPQCDCNKGYLLKGNECVLPADC
ncbi:alpha-tectorin-like [Engystomops pustulosus]|uniref:alpha-tectorin-like n=1 Tax=Engystomops pustulosus TaxID=76066 RepID=UPI003AFAC6B1